jgi:uncharacterized membrane protein YkgB
MGIDLNKIIESVSRTHLKGGLFSNACRVVIAAIICIAAIVSINTSWLGCIAVVLIFLLVLIALWWLIAFADRHPQAAVMEGAEFLNYEQIQLTAKNSIMQPLSATIEDAINVQQLIADEPDASDVDEKENNNV